MPPPTKFQIYFYTYPLDNVQKFGLPISYYYNFVLANFVVSNTVEERALMLPTEKFCIHSKRKCAYPKKA